MIQYRRC